MRQIQEAKKKKENKVKRGEKGMDFLLYIRLNISVVLTVGKTNMTTSEIKIKLKSYDIIMIV